MMWAPFVEQTIAMVRDHKRVYRRGPGYTKSPDGHHTERCVHAELTPHTLSLPRPRLERYHTGSTCDHMGACPCHLSSRWVGFVTMPFNQVQMR